MNVTDRTHYVTTCSTRASHPHLDRPEPAHAAAAAAPEEAEPLDPVVGGHGGVPDPAAAIVHALIAGRHQELNRE